MTQTFTRRSFIAGGAAAVVLSNAPWLFAQADEKPAFQFKETNFYFRWTNGKLFEFTPSGQANLNTYSDMVSVLVYRDVKTPDNLAAQANAVLQNYKDHNGVVLKTSSVPVTSEKPAEHFLAVMLADEGVVEGTFARFMLLGGMGYAVLYAHRIYGPVLHDNSEALGKWENANGPAVEDALMKFVSVPSIDKLEQWVKTAGAK